ncbi:MAG TPA: universal stress protein [Longimicrobiales bacterium]|nr:universal stress protein [Longimicrobiales bacterium]
MIRTIIVPTDGSDFAEHALPLAIATARRTDARLELIRVHEPPPPPISPDVLLPGDALQRWDEAIREAERDSLAKLRQRVRDSTGLDPEALLADGIVEEALADRIAAAADPLVVISSHGRGGLARAWLGSVADGLVRRVRAPLIVVRPHERAVAFDQAPPVRRMLVPLDGSSTAERVLGAVVDLARAWEANATLLIVLFPLWMSDRKEEAELAGTSRVSAIREAAANYLGGVAEELRGNGVEADVEIVVDSNPASAILKFAADHDIDLLALATHGRGGAERVYMGSVADKVRRGAPMPVLMVNAGPEVSPAEPG